MCVTLGGGGGGGGSTQSTLGSKKRLAGEGDRTFGDQAQSKNKAGRASQRHCPEGHKTVHTKSNLKLGCYPLRRGSTVEGRGRGEWG